MLIATQRLYQPIGYQALTEVIVATWYPWLLPFLDVLNQRTQESKGKQP
jgi:hypothetical protein